MPLTTITSRPLATDHHQYHLLATTSGCSPLRLLVKKELVRLFVDAFGLEVFARTLLVLQELDIAL
jgi:hypothetical protein